MYLSYIPQDMEDVWEKWEFSPTSKNILSEICLQLKSENEFQMSTDWYALLNYKSNSHEFSPMEVDVIESNAEEEIFNAFKEALEGDAVFPEAKFLGISFDSMSRIFSSVKSFINVNRFCSFCKCTADWRSDTLVELALALVVLPKLKEIPEASACIIYALKELAIKKPNQFSQSVLIPLLFNVVNLFTDVELLSRIFPLLPTPQKDMIILNFCKKTEFLENDWLLLYPLIKDLSQNSLLYLLECIQKFSFKFTKSLVFGRCLVSFCKNLDLISNKDVLKEVIENHQTLLKAQALKYLELV